MAAPPCGLAVRCREAAAGVMPAVRIGPVFGRRRLAGMRRLGHQLAGCTARRRRTREVDDDEGEQRGRDRRRRQRRGRIGGAQQAVDGPGLAADLGGDPAGQHRDEARRAHHQREAVQPASSRRACRARGATGSTDAEQQHQQAQADHDAEATRRRCRTGGRSATGIVSAPPAARPGRASGSARTPSESRSRSRRGSRRCLGMPNRISGAPFGWLW